MSKVVCRAGMLALLMTLTGWSDEARAQSYQFITVETLGGFIPYNDKMTAWADVDDGQVTRGHVLVERDFHDDARVVKLRDSLSAEEAYDLWLACHQAQPWEHVEVQGRVVSVELPDTRVTYTGIFSQTIVSSLPRPDPDLPPVSVETERCVDRAWDVAARAVRRAKRR